MDLSCLVSDGVNRALEKLSRATRKGEGGNFEKGPIVDYPPSLVHETCELRHGGSIRTGGLIPLLLLAAVISLIARFFTGRTAL